MDDPSEEVTMIERARLEGARAFILCPLGEPLLDSSIQALAAAHIPLVLSQTYSSDYGIKIEPDDDLIGSEQGSFAGQIFLNEA